MATLANNVMTLADWAKLRDPDGAVDKVVEILGQTNEILDDMMWKEGNLPIGERTTIRTGLPTVYWRLLNQGVPPSKATTAQVTDTTGKLEAWCEVDKDLADLNGNTPQFRLSQSKAFIEAMNQEMAAKVFYGNASINAEQFTGLSVRYSSLAAANAQNIIRAGGSGSDNTSIWLITWGEDTVHGIFPKGSKAGLDHKDLGEQVVETTAGIGGNRMLAYRDRFQWNPGLTVKDWRYAVRICNIDVSELAGQTANAADLTQFMVMATHRIPSLKAGRSAFYANRTVMQYLDLQRRDEVSAGGGLTYDTVDGKPVYGFRGIPIKTVDALVENEQAVS